MRQRGFCGATDYENTSFREIDEASRAGNGRITDAHVVPGGTDTDYFHLGTHKDGYFLWLNRWARQKGYEVAIEVARRTGIPLTLSGLHPDDTWAADHKEHALRALELARDLPNVRFEWLPKWPPKAHHDRKRALLQGAKAFLFPLQFQEPFGLGQVEALACGTPVIGTNFGSVPEVVQHGRTGFVCDTMEELEAAVTQVGAIDPEECRLDAVARFDRRVMARAYLAEYQAVIEGRGWGL
jgi:glycosyltransferase involved in cell wall biosynthesis